MDRQVEIDELEDWGDGELLSRARLNLTVGAINRVIREYRSLKETCERLRREIADLGDQVRELREEIERIRRARAPVGSGSLRSDER
jgi:hypothetical protein